MENPFKNFQIKHYYNYMLVLGGFILILSLIYETKILSQGKLATISIITILYGLIEWIRERQFNERINQLQIDWSKYWGDESEKKEYSDIMDKTWEARTRKKFEEEHNMNNLLPNYQKKIWINLIIYIIIISAIIIYNMLTPII